MSSDNRPRYRCRPDSICRRHRLLSSTRPIIITITTTTTTLLVLLLQLLLLLLLLLRLLLLQLLLLLLLLLPTYYLRLLLLLLLLLLPLLLLLLLLPLLPLLLPYFRSFFAPSAANNWSPLQHAANSWSCTLPNTPPQHRQQLVLTECAANSCSPAEPACQTCTDLLALAATRPNAYWLCSQRPSMPVQISQDRQSMPAKHATTRFYSTEDSSQAASNLAATRCEF